MVIEILVQSSNFLLVEAQKSPIMVSTIILECGFLTISLLESIVGHSSFHNLYYCSATPGSLLCWALLPVYCVRESISPASQPQRSRAHAQWKLQVISGVVRQVLHASIFVAGVELCWVPGGLDVAGRVLGYTAIARDLFCWSLMPVLSTRGNNFASMQRLTLQFVTLPKTPGIAKGNGLRQTVLCPGHQKPILARFEASRYRSDHRYRCTVGPATLLNLLT
jgi:hypothetical protein